MRFAMVGAVLLMGCTELAGPPALGSRAFADTCDARAQRGLVGQELRDMAAVAAAAPKVRFLGPGDLATTDEQPDRLNVELDANRIVTRVYCG